MTEDPSLAFIDTETTGLEPDRHQIWEVAAIIRRPGQGDREYLWHLPVNLADADPMALQIGGFYDRHGQSASLSGVEEFAPEIGDSIGTCVPTAGAHTLDGVVEATGYPRGTVYGWLWDLRLAELVDWEDVKKSTLHATVDVVALERLDGPGIVRVVRAGTQWPAA